MSISLISVTFTLFYFPFVVLSQIIICFHVVFVVASRKEGRDNLMATKVKTEVTADADNAAEKSVIDASDTVYECRHQLDSDSSASSSAVANAVAVDSEAADHCVKTEDEVKRPISHLPHVTDACHDVDDDDDDGIRYLSSVIFVSLDHVCIA